MFVVERVQRLTGAAKKLPVPEGTWAIGAGLIIVGLSAYGFQILAAKRLPNADYNALNVLWAMGFVLTPGLFQPLEQEAGRAVAARRVRGEGGAPLMKPGPEARYSELSGALAWLLLGSVLAQLLSYASVFGVNSLAHTQHEKDLAAAFITGLFVARVPLLLFQAVQAALLPKLSALASEGKHDDLKVGMRRLVMVVLAVCSLGVLAGTVIGPCAGSQLVDSKSDLR